MLFLPIVEILRTGDLHSKAKVTQAAGQVCLHQDVTGIQVPVTDARFQLVWKQDDMQSVNHQSQTQKHKNLIRVQPLTPFSHICVQVGKPPRYR
jgi:2-phospho-L-lactate transferase/gluconeogenesis factor (CofD/UPF0052 family)